MEVIKESRDLFLSLNNTLEEDVRQLSEGDFLWAINARSTAEATSMGTHEMRMSPAVKLVKSEDSNRNSP